jgi:hypothetical protein
MPTATYELISSGNGNGSADTITLSSIPATYTDLVLVIKAKNASGALSGVRVRFNGDTNNNNYSGVRISVGPSTIDDERDPAGLYAINAINDEFNVGVVNIMNYSSTAMRKSTLTLSGWARSAGDFVRVHLGTWRDTSAITSVTLFNDTSYAWTTDSTITLYGIKAS